MGNRKDALTDIIQAISNDKPSGKPVQDLKPNQVVNSDGQIIQLQQPKSSSR